MPNKQGQFDVK